MSREAQLAIVVNGKEREIASGSRVTDLLEAIDCHPQTVAIEYNGEILPKGRYADTVLAEGDRLEVVRFVQGG